MRMATPGAATVALPVLLKVAIAWVLSVAATPMTPEIPEGYVDVAEASLPVAAITTMSLLCAYAIASARAAE